MKNKLPLLLGTLLIMIAACAAQKKGGKSSQQSPAITSITMHRTACFGRCPDYSIELHADGQTTYNGYRFTDHQGVYEKNIGAAKAAELIQQFKNYRVDTCQNEYRMLVSDLPGIIYTIRTGEDSKTIRNAHFGPGFLKTLAKSMDEAIKVDNSWKKVADTAIKG